MFEEFLDFNNLLALNKAIFPVVFLVLSDTADILFCFFAVSSKLSISSDFTTENLHFYFGSGSKIPGTRKTLLVKGKID